MKIIGKKANKILIWAILWTAILWLWWFSMTPKWKSFFDRLKDKFKWFKWFIELWINEFLKKVKSKK